MKKIPIVAVLAFLGFSAISHGQVSPVGVGTNGVNNDIICTGEATIEATPDIARVRLGLEWQTNTAEAAQASVAQTMEGASVALQRIGLASTAIRASAIDVALIYTPALGGYQADRIAACRAEGTMEVTVGATQMALLGRIVDAALQSGVSRLQGIRFDISPNFAGRNEALSQAEQDARNKARTIASGLGLRLDGIDSVQDNGLTVSQSNAPMLPGGELAPVTGTVRLHASVTLHYHFSAKADGAATTP